MPLLRDLVHIYRICNNLSSCRLKSYSKIKDDDDDDNNNNNNFNCNWVVTRWQWLFYMYTNIKKKVTRKFKSGGLHERDVAATWKLMNHLSIHL